MRGPKPKPAAVRALHNSRKRPHHRDEPEIPESGAQTERVTVPSPPADLVAGERKYWSRFAPLLAGAKLLTPADVETLADYCRACEAVASRGRRLRAVLTKPSSTLQEIKMLDAQLRGWVQQKTKLASELGLTAVSRTRVAWSGHHQVLDKKDKPKSELARLQEQAASMRRPVAVK